MTMSSLPSVSMFREVQLVHETGFFPGLSSIDDSYQEASVTSVLYLQVAQLLQSDCAAGCVSFGQKWKTGTGRQHFTDIIALSSTTVTQSACKAIEFGKNAK